MEMLVKLFVNVHVEERGLLINVAVVVLIWIIHVCRLNCWIVLPIWTLCERRVLSCHIATSKIIVIVVLNNLNLSLVWRVSS